MKTYSLDEVTNKYVGKRGTKERESFEQELKLELLGEAVKKARKERNLTQAQLGELVGVQKSQISKIENNLKETKFGTIRRYVEALKVNKMSLRFEFDNGNSEELQLI